MKADTQGRIEVPTKTKAEAGYRISTGNEQCGGCVMFNGGNCDLVIGPIESYSVCRYWESP